MNRFKSFILQRIGFVCFGSMMAFVIVWLYGTKHGLFGEYLQQAHYNESTLGNIVIGLPVVASIIIAIHIAEKYDQRYK